ncbi:Fe-S cluster assembly protein SufD [Omnitrophica bacterium]|nr:Fe-S cluster assembly protein SufD [Candidatus Omnitrophota bacterium]
MTVCLGWGITKKDIERMNSMMETDNYRSRLLGLGYQMSPKAPAWLNEVQKKTFERFRKLGFPGRKSEAWKNISVERILNAPFIPCEDRSFEVDDQHVFDRYNLVKDGERRMTFLNSVYSEKYSLNQELPSGVVLEELKSVLTNNPEILHGLYGARIEAEDNVFCAVNALCFKHGIFLDVPAGKIMDAPIHLVFSGMGDKDNPPAFYPRILVRLGCESRVNLVTSYISLNREPYFMAGAAEVFLDRGAQLNWTMVQRQRRMASKVLKARCFLAAGSRLERAAFIRGGDISYDELEVFMEGPGASCRCDGLAVLAGNSQSSKVVKMHHLASHCQSRQTFKNILTDRAQGEFNSIVNVAPGTHGSDSHQMNRNLILSDEARAYSRPQLKIDADDVKASHGSATGQLNEGELFYLQSRGLSLPTAKYILTYGFAEEILEKIKPDSVRWQLELLVRKGIESMVSGSPGQAGG